MRMALINAPYFDPYFMENIKVVEKHLRSLPPLGLMYVSSIAKSCGHDVVIIDAVAEHLSKRKVLKKLKEFKPDIIGFSVIVPIRGKLFEWIKYLRNKLSVPVVVGGNALLYYPEAILSNDFIDYAIIGPAGKSLPRLLENLENGTVKNPEGIGFKKDGNIYVNYPSDIRKNMDSLPLPDRTSLDNSLYTSIVSRERPYTIMMTSSGCIYHCDFCPMGRMPYEERGVKNVIREIEKCRDIGIKEIDIQDENFLLNKERAIKIMEEIIKRKIDIKISCRARVDSVDEKTLSILKKAGCRLIMYGIESGNEKILRREHKGINREQIRKAVGLAKKAGMKTLGFFIIGHRGESRETVRDTIEFSKELGLDYVQFFHMVIKPGTKLYDGIKEDMGYDYFDAVLRGKMKEKDIMLPWTELSNKEIRRWILRAYFSFYFRRKNIGDIIGIPVQWVRLSGAFNHKS